MTTKHQTLSKTDKNTNFNITFDEINFKVSFVYLKNYNKYCGIYNFYDPIFDDIPSNCMHDAFNNFIQEKKYELTEKADCVECLFKFTFFGKNKTILIKMILNNEMKGSFERIRFKLSTDPESTKSFNNFLTARQYNIRLFRVVDNEIEFAVQKSDNQQIDQFEYKVINPDHVNSFSNFCDFVEINKKYNVKYRDDAHNDVAIELCIKNCLPSGDNWYMVKN